MFQPRSVRSARSVACLHCLNPVTAPIHMLHVGLWFGTPDAAVAAGCPNTQTPFNGDHTAEIQVLSTRNFTVNGPLRSLAP